VKYRHKLLSFSFRATYIQHISTNLIIKKNNNDCPCFTNRNRENEREKKIEMGNMSEHGNGLVEQNNGEERKIK